MNRLLEIVEEINEKLNNIDGLSDNYLVYAECVRNREDDYTAIKLTDHTLWDHWGDVTSFNEEEIEYTKDLIYGELYTFLRNMSLYFKVVAKEVGDGSNEEVWQKLEEAAKLVLKNEEKLTKIEKEEEFAEIIKLVTKVFREDVMQFVSKHGKPEKKQISPIDLMDMINNLEDRLLANV